jgi:hypothetical protein
MLSIDTNTRDNSLISLLDNRPSFIPPSLVGSHLLCGFSEWAHSHKGQSQLCVQEIKLPAGRTASGGASCCVAGSTPVRFMTSSSHGLPSHVSRQVTPPELATKQASVSWTVYPHCVVASTYSIIINGGLKDLYCATGSLTGRGCNCNIPDLEHISLRFLLRP